MVSTASVLVPTADGGSSEDSSVSCAEAAIRYDTRIVVADTPGAVAPPLAPCQAGWHATEYADHGTWRTPGPHSTPDAASPAAPMAVAGVIPAGTTTPGRAPPRADGAGRVGTKRSTASRATTARPRTTRWTAMARSARCRSGERPASRRRRRGGGAAGGAAPGAVAVAVRALRASSPSPKNPATTPPRRRSPGAVSANSARPPRHGGWSACRRAWRRLLHDAEKTAPGAAGS